MENTTSCFITTLEKEGYLLSKVRSGAEIGLAEAKENSAIVSGLSAGDIYPILVDIRTIKSISKEARDHFAMRDREPGVSAIAMLVASPVSRIIGNFFLGLNRPAVPTRMFSSNEDALNWIKKRIREKQVGADERHA
ncbi:MAG: hypothetical protein FD123_2842 [Bacteroidetes bacterium]|nr:MAG: hypothetical protein FD123_2842 [Bacteroidota bacterium]